ncbi:GNAT family N-acetyltransferase [Pontixanthobacter gangjinensis]|uniref:GNAT family N-acetyltransferase n=1 Tax=Pontixanthobacter gangjinensis TaxID=1028742 RepID=A0A6I4SLV4_9SPHN|nr:GNAT family N-acetyltransferase [Pontixanthobacter gangjinensis]
MILRPASLDDVTALAALGRDSFLAAFEHLYKPSDLAAFLEQAYSLEGVGGDLAHPNLVYRLAEDAEGLAGYCKIAKRSAYAEHSDAVRPMALNQLYTAPGRTGQGIGAALMDWALAEARELGADAMQLSVYSENYGAQRFYQRYGFTKIADIGFWVGEQRDAEFLYELRLD